MQTEPNIEAAPEASDAEAAESTPTAGETLREARGRLGLSEKEVADRLHITMHYVKSLESDSYEKLPGAVFAKGYIRSYALLLGLDAQEVVARYDQHTSQQKADIEEASRANARRKKRDRNKPFVIVSMVVFVGGSLGLWLVNSYFGEEPVANAPPLATANSVSESQATAPVSQIAQVPQTQPQLSLDVEQEPQVEPAVASAPTIAEPSEPQVAAVADSAAAPQDSLDADTASGAANLQNLAALLQPPAPESTDSAAAIAEPGPRIIAVEASGNDVLRISFSGESWVEVNDSESEQIYRDIREAGDILEITGSAPFNILLGDAPFTHMSLNGNEIDLSSDIRIDNSARLTVGL